MTKEEILKEYLEWLGTGESPCSDELEGMAIGELPLGEDDRRLFWRNFYLISNTSSGTLRCFIYYEDVTYDKDENGDLTAAYTSWNIFSK